jgi:hypothetical protein
MAITYTGTNGLFTRLGKLFQVATVLNTFRSTLSNEIDDVFAEFTSGSAPFTHPEGPFDVYQIEPLNKQKDLTEAYFTNIDAVIQTSLMNIINGAVRDGLKKPADNFHEAFSFLVEDMLTYSAGFFVTEHALTTAGTLAAGSANVGNGTVLVSNNRPIAHAGATGKIESRIRSEEIRAICTADLSNGLGGGNEIFVFEGEEQKPRFSKEWPGGSGAIQDVQVTSAGKSNTRRDGAGINILQNSDFNLWSDATNCELWTFGGTGNNLAHTNGGQGGSLTVDTQRVTSSDLSVGGVFGERGQYNIQFNGNGSFKHTATQKTNSSDGTPSRVKGNCSYFWSCRIRANHHSISSGVLRLSLFNGSSSTIADTSVSVDFSSVNLTNSWTHLSGEIQLDRNTTVEDLRVVIEFTTALQADRSLVMAELVFAMPRPLYLAGPKVLVVRGETDYRTNDTFTLTYVNNYAGVFQKFFDQYLGDMGDYTLPTGSQKSSGSTNINDNLVA